MSKIRVVVVDDHPLFREGVIHTLQSEPEIQVSLSEPKVFAMKVISALLVMVAR